VVDSYEELLSYPFRPFFLVDVVDDKESRGSHASQEVFPGRVELIIEGVLHHGESGGPVDHETISPVPSDDFIRYDCSGGGFSRTDITPEIESFGPVR